MAVATVPTEETMPGVVVPSGRVTLTPVTDLHLGLLLRVQGDVTTGLVEVAVVAPCPAPPPRPAPSSRPAR